MKVKATIGETILMFKDIRFYLGKNSTLFLLVSLWDVVDPWNLMKTDTRIGETILMLMDIWFCTRKIVFFFY